MTADFSPEFAVRELAHWRCLMEELSALGHQVAAARKAHNARLTDTLQGEFDALALKADVQLARAVAATRRPPIVRPMSGSQAACR
jgi:hypothetical protein